MAVNGFPVTKNIKALLMAVSKAPNISIDNKFYKCYNIDSRKGLIMNLKR